MNKEHVNGIIEGLKEVIAHLKGEIELEEVFFNKTKIHDLREQQHLTQQEFAKLFGVSVRTLQQWEQGRRQPQGPAQVLLKVIMHNPNAVKEALAKANH